MRGKFGQPGNFLHIRDAAAHIVPCTALRGAVLARHRAALEQAASSHVAHANSSGHGPSLHFTQENEVFVPKLDAGFELDCIDASILSFKVHWLCLKARNPSQHRARLRMGGQTCFVFSFSCKRALQVLDPHPVVPVPMHPGPEHPVLSLSSSKNSQSCQVAQCFCSLECK